MKYVILSMFLLVVSCKNETKQNQLVKANVEQKKEVDLKVYDFNSLEKLLTTTNDTTYVVNFWATWCAPCVKELPYFEQLHTDYANKKMKIILVSLDFPSKYESNLKPFILKNKLQSKVVALNDKDSNSWIPKVDENWSGAIPATIIFTKEKRQFYEQSFDYEELKTEVNKFLN